MNIGKKKIEEDFNSIKAELNKINYKSLLTDEAILNIKKVHKVSYGICIWRIYLNENNDLNIMQYALDEIFSTYVQAIYMIPFNDNKILNFLARNIIDNFIKYVKNAKHINNNQFNEVINKLKSFNDEKCYIDSLDQISGLYKKSCNFIHSTYKKNCSLIEGIKSYKEPKNKYSQNVANNLYILGKNINYIFIILFNSIYGSKMIKLNRNIILETLDNKKRKSVRKLFY